MARPTRGYAARRPNQRGGGRGGSSRGRTSFNRSGFGSSAQAVIERLPIELPPRLTVQELADRLEVTPSQAITELVKQNILLTINQSVDYETAAKVATGLGFEVLEAPE